MVGYASIVTLVAHVKIIDINVKDLLGAKILPVNITTLVVVGVVVLAGVVGIIVHHVMMIVILIVKQ